MLRKLKVTNFTVFKDAEFEFIDGLNVVIGANGSGKSHLLKLAYACMKLAKDQGGLTRPPKSQLQRMMGDYLINIFQTESVGRLSSRTHGHTSTNVNIDFQKRKAGFGCSFSTRSKSEIVFTKEAEDAIPRAPIFIPPKEVLTFYPWLLGQYDNYDLPIDQTYPDLCRLLQGALLKGPKADQVSEMARSLEEMIGGKIRVENNRFYLVPTSGTAGRLEIDLVAEGYRKLGLLAYLLLNGTLNNETTLFWDEPEANLNNKLIQSLSEILIQFANRKFQLVIATHSLFMLKELHILSKEKSVPVRYFSFSEEDGQQVVSSSDDLGEVHDIPALDAELEQSNRFSI